MRTIIVDGILLIILFATIVNTRPHGGSLNLLLSSGSTSSKSTTSSIATTNSTTTIPLKSIDDAGVNGKKNLKNFNKYLDDLLENFYEQFIKEKFNNVNDTIKIIKKKPIENSDYDRVDDDAEMMQGDQPIVDNFESTISPNNNGTDLLQYQRTIRNRQRENNDQDERTKESWKKNLKETILRYIGRSDSNMTRIDSKLPAINITDIQKLINSTTFDNDYITEKIRSYYPSCEIPSNTDQDMWKDENIMNLYFNFDYNSFEKNQIIATAILRLYRIPQNATKTTYKLNDCENNTLTEEEKLLRVSIYWYTKSLRKRRVKRRLSDSKVITENEPWVELSVKPATKAWSRGRNLGLAVVVEDQDGNTLRTDKFFKGASCMVGASTPKPIPTIIIDAARKSNELARIQGLLGGNSTPSPSSDVLLLPSIDICTLELPDNQTLPIGYEHHLNACNLRQLHEKKEKTITRVKFERLASLSDILQSQPPNHIRHQQHHLHIDTIDPRL